MVVLVAMRVRITGRNCRLPLRASLVQLCRPVQDHGHGRSLGFVHWSDDQKSLAVPADVIDKHVIDWDWLPGSGVKKCPSLVPATRAIASLPLDFRCPVQDD